MGRRESTETGWKDAAAGLAAGTAFPFVEELVLGGTTDDINLDEQVTAFEQRATKHGEESSYELTEAEMEAVMNTIDADEMQSMLPSHVKSASAVVLDRVDEAASKDSPTQSEHTRCEDPFEEASAIVLKRTCAEQEAEKHLPSYTPEFCKSVDVVQAVAELSPGDGSAVELPSSNDAFANASESRSTAVDANVDAASGPLKGSERMELSQVAPRAKPAHVRWSCESEGKHEALAAHGSMDIAAVDPLIHDLRHVYDNISGAETDHGEKTQQIVRREPFLELVPDEIPAASERQEAPCPVTVEAKDRGKKKANKIRSGDSGATGQQELR